MTTAPSPTGLARRTAALPGTPTPPTKCRPTGKCSWIIHFRTAERDRRWTFARQCAREGGARQRSLVQGAAERTWRSLQMLQPAIEILNAHRTMSVSTVRPDGWPQTTIVGYANDGWTVYFLIFRSSQKFANIAHDDRISIAVSGDPNYLSDIKAVYAGAHAAEVTDGRERDLAWKLLLQRHPNLADFGPPDQT